MRHYRKRLSIIVHVTRHSTYSPDRINEKMTWNINWIELNFLFFHRLYVFMMIKEKKQRSSMFIDLHVSGSWKGGREKSIRVESQRLKCSIAVPDVYSRFDFNVFHFFAFRKFNFMSKRGDFDWKPFCIFYSQARSLS